MSFRFTTASSPLATLIKAVWWSGNGKKKEERDEKRQKKEEEVDGIKQRMETGQ